MNLKCKMCGGTLDLSDFKNQKVIECPYCGSAQTIPNVDDEKRQMLHDRANSLRLANEFDKAIITYENLINEDGKDSEAYFGLVLCKYGIEYVTDPASGEKIPTCHRTNVKSLLDDADYKNALKYADVVSKMYYQVEGQKIDEIMKKTLMISQKEEPFDIFISYKETDFNNNRTPDSVIAQDIYDNLVSKGYKVFFARRTLENKLGEMYEPIIYQALRTSKVMLLIGSSLDYLNAPWVKNEWSRYLTFMKEDKSKHLIPCYKGIDPYSLPDEFSFLQSQDLSKLGYMQDLVYGIEKLLGKKVEAVKEVKEPSKVDNLLLRCQILIDDGDTKKANDIIEEILNIDVKCPKAYLYRLVISNNFKTLEDLKTLETSLSKNVNFKHAKDFSTTKEDLALIKDIEDSINENILKKEKELATQKKASEAAKKAEADKKALEEKKALEAKKALEEKKAAEAAKKAEAQKKADSEKAEREETLKRVADKKSEENAQIKKVIDKLNNLEGFKIGLDGKPISLNGQLNALRDRKNLSDVISSMIENEDAEALKLLKELRKKGYPLAVSMVKEFNYYKSTILSNAIRFYKDNRYYYNALRLCDAYKAYNKKDAVALRKAIEADQREKNKYDFTNYKMYAADYELGEKYLASGDLLKAKEAFSKCKYDISSGIFGNGNYYKDAYELINTKCNQETLDALRKTYTLTVEANYGDSLQYCSKAIHQHTCYLKFNLIALFAREEVYALADYYSKQTYNEKTAIRYFELLGDYKDSVKRIEDLKVVIRKQSGPYSVYNIQKPKELFSYVK